jgi:hypothetical protein
MTTDMKPCVQCGKEVSPLAKACPSCGQPNPAQPKWVSGASAIGSMLLTLGVICLLVFGGLICAGLK